MNNKRFSEVIETVNLNIRKKYRLIEKKTKIKILKILLLKNTITLSLFKKIYCITVLYFIKYM